MATALLIMLREGFEAALVVAIVFAYLRRIQRLDLSSAVWQGVGLAVAISLAVGVVVHLTIGNLEGAARLRSFAAISFLALGIASVLAWAVYFGGRSMPMKAFFTATGVVLIVFAAGLASRTVLFLQGAGDLGSMNLNGVYDLTAYDWLTQSTEVGKFLAAMFGWDPRPSIEQVVVYLGYLVPVLTLFLRPQPVPARPRSRVA